MKSDLRAWAQSSPTFRIETPLASPVAACWNPPIAHPFPKLIPIEMLLTCSVPSPNEHSPTAARAARGRAVMVLPRPVATSFFVFVASGHQVAPTAGPPPAESDGPG